MKYLDAYRKLHEDNQFPGTSLKPWVSDIALLIAEHGTTSLLDYGCGGGYQYHVERFHEVWGIKPTLYDPAVNEYAQKPRGKFDGVISTDVLEHIPEEELPDVFKELASYARQWAFITVCCRPAKRTFPDGTNVHVTVKPFVWWQEKLGRAFNGRAKLILREAP